MLGPLEDELAERASPLPPARRERLQTAHRNSLRLLKLVNTLLDFSRIEAGRAQASYEPSDLAAYTAELASVFRSAVDKAGLTLVVNCPPLPEPVYVDREMWEKIVLNLLSNAFKHTFEGSITITLRWLGDYAELAVSDTGVGIPKTELPRLFERFHRVKGARSRTHEGTGIGLALVQELVSLHSGAVCIESEEGKGSTFTVTVRTGTAHIPPDRRGAARSLVSTARVRREWANGLEQANKELEAFSYSVSHDLRAPLRAIDGFSALLLEEHAEGLDQQACNYIRRIRTGIQKMSGLIDNLLNLSRVSRAPLRKEMIDLTELAQGVVTDLQSRDPAREVAVDIAEGLCACGDAPLMTIVLVNLLGNAWKYSAKQPTPRIAFGRETREKETKEKESIFYVCDNGAGFDMAHAAKLFTPFHRLHEPSHFQGTGIGLATAQRMILRHDRRIWADAAPGAGATFFFTLGDNQHSTN